VKILAATSGPKPAREKADYVIRIAKMLDAHLITLHVFAEDKLVEGREALRVFYDAGIRDGVRVTEILVKGDVVGNIVEKAETEGADLIIMGMGESKDATEWLSSQVLQHTRIPVVVIPHAFAL